MNKLIQLLRDFYKPEKKLTVLLRALTEKNITYVFRKSASSVKKLIKVFSFTLFVDYIIIKKALKRRKYVLNKCFIHTA